MSSANLLMHLQLVVESSTLVYRVSSFAPQYTAVYVCFYTKFSTAVRYACRVAQNQVQNQVGLQSTTGASLCAANCRSPSCHHAVNVYSSHSVNVYWTPCLQYSSMYSVHEYCLRFILLVVPPSLLLRAAWRLGATRNSRFRLLGRRRCPHPRLGFGRIAVSEKEAPNMLVILV